MSTESIPGRLRVVYWQNSVVAGEVKLRYVNGQKGGPCEVDQSELEEMIRHKSWSYVT